MVRSPHPPAVQAGNPLPSAATLFLLSALLLQGAVGLHRGAYHPFAPTLLVAAVVLGGLGLRQVQRSAPGPTPEGALAVLIAGVFHGWAAPSWPLYTIGAPWPFELIAVGFLGLGATYTLRLRGPTSARVTAARRGLALALFAAGCGLTLHLSPAPRIDVFTLQTEGAKALLAGANPYASIAVPDTNPHNPAGPVPYTYPPLQLLLTTAGLLLGGDVRCAMAVALVVAALALLLATPAGGPGAAADAPALSLMAGSSVFFVLEQSWVDSTGLGLLAAGTVLVQRRRCMAGALVLGLAAATKQPLVVALPLLGLLPGLSRRHLAGAAAAAATPWLLFAVADLRALFASTVAYLAALPPRPDALTLFGKMAFANYYFLVAGLFALAAACSMGEATAPPGAHSPVVGGAAP